MILCDSYNNTENRLNSYFIDEEAKGQRPSKRQNWGWNPNPELLDFHNLIMLLFRCY